MHQNDLRYILKITNEPLLRSYRTVMTAANTEGGPTRAERTEACSPLAYANTCPTANAVSTYYLYGPACHVTMFGLPALANLPTFTQHEWHVKHNTWSAWCIPGTDEHQHQQTNIPKSRTLKYSAYKASYSTVKSVDWKDIYRCARPLFVDSCGHTAGTRSCGERLDYHQAKITLSLQATNGQFILAVSHLHRLRPCDAAYAHRRPSPFRCRTDAKLI